MLDVVINLICDILNLVNDLINLRLLLGKERPVDDDVLDNVLQLQKRIQQHV